ncbi:uncharacterized protein CMU_016430 [Cryptosporidium muris RN66]|uniref:Thioredoxin domain-containing protein n=1 Tax=Cryptosporidium muris (strain RN66) TaxID=441375 RepID=B6ACP0_CRYMR|nr:uncharacterized protein CMU_016430 [Cryptosporidium muris RN66]EEA05894.1 hypothetical protein, conserved [Cryptosporidium muris RN66]|eukprot:XP_002140243.1 hypothetical protein [Cryptosporidium muris RN66]
MAVSDPLNITTIYFSAEFSTSSLSLLNEYIELKQLYPSIKFLLVDIDECPRAAYNYDITDIPSICIVRGVDIVNELITKKVNGNILNIIQETKIIIEKELQNLKNYTWPSEYIRQILPQSTGSKSAYWHHNIGLDNSNIIDLGWLRP